MPKSRLTINTVAAPNVKAARRWRSRPCQRFTTGLPSPRPVVTPEPNVKSRQVQWQSLFSKVVGNGAVRLRFSEKRFT